MLVVIGSLIGVVAGLVIGALVGSRVAIGRKRTAAEAEIARSLEMRAVLPRRSAARRRWRRARKRSRPARTPRRS